MKKEKRLIDIDKELFNGVMPSMQYNNMSQLDLLNRYYETLEKIFSMENIRIKALNLLKTGYFKKPGSKDVGFFEKVIGSIILIKRYYFSNDQEKKKLFKDLCALGVKKIAAWDRIAFALLSMAGFHDFICNTRLYLDDIRKKIKLYDKGPFNPKYRKKIQIKKAKV